MHWVFRRSSNEKRNNTHTHIKVVQNAFPCAMLDRCSPARMHFHPPSSPSPSFFGFQNKICFRRVCVYKMSIQIKFCRCRCRVEFNVDSWELPVLDSFVLWIMAHFMYRFLKTHNFNCRFSQFYILFPPFVLLIAKPFFSTSDCLLKIVIIPTNQLLNIIWDSLNRTITSKVQIYFSKFCETFESKGFFSVCVCSINFHSFFLCK